MNKIIIHCDISKLISIFDNFMIEGEKQYGNKSWK